MKNCRKCDGLFSAKDPRTLHCSRACGSAGPEKPKKTCRECSRPFVPARHAPGIYCSNRCSTLARRGAVRARHSRVFFRRCPSCALSFVARNSRTRCCSSACRRVENIVSATVSYRAKSRRSYAGRSCPECGIGFQPCYGEFRRRFCSTACCDRHHSRIAKGLRDERAQRNGIEPFDPLEILARDGWRCRMCGVDTPRSLRGTFEDNAPELDHIRPLSRGGGHTRANTQCACRRCNIEKSDAIARPAWLVLGGGDGGWVGMVDRMP